MTLLDRITPAHYRLRAPGRTIRLRLTVLYASLFLVSGVGLLSVTYVLVRHATGDVLTGQGPDGSSFMIRGNTGKAPGKAQLARTSQTQVFGGGTDRNGLPGPRLSAKQLEAQFQRDKALAERQRASELHQLAEQSGVALLIMATLSIGIGWFAAGRVLRPLRTINERAREISARNLDMRLALTGPDDELTQLAGTFDDLLGRLETSFAAQRQFVANASHELRTPLTRAQAIAEVALDDPGATVETLRASHRRVLVAGRQQERLIESLLTLARSERGLDQREPFDLAAVASRMLDPRQEDAERHGVTLHAVLEPARTTGNPQLAERLVTNLVDNAVRHNLPHGHVDVRTATTETGQAVLVVSNSGPVVPPDELDRLLLPFQRLVSDRTDHSNGVGLGLSIVAAIAAAHGATLDARARHGGGLEIDVTFPAVDESSHTAVVTDSHREPARSPRRLALRPRVLSAASRRSSR